MPNAENDCPCGRGPGHVRIKTAGCTPSAEKDAARLALIRELERHIGAHASIVANDLLAAGWRVFPPAVPACTCNAGDAAEFAAQHATLCPRFAHPRVFPPAVIDITGGPLSPGERAIHEKYQSDDPAANYYDPTPIPPEPTHTLNEHGTTDCPVERVRAYADDGKCSACGGRVLPPDIDGINAGPRGGITT